MKYEGLPPLIAINPYFLWKSHPAPPGCHYDLLIS